MILVLARYHILNDISSCPVTPSPRRTQGPCRKVSCVPPIPSIAAELAVRLAGASPQTTWHNIFSFHEPANNYLRTLKRGSLVYVEANFEIRQPSPDADPDSPEGQRQIFLRHGTWVLLYSQAKH